MNNSPPDSKDIEKKTIIANLTKIINAINEDYYKILSGKISLNDFWKNNYPRIIEIKHEKKFKKILSPKNYKDITAYVVKISTLLEKLDLADKQGDNETATIKTNQVKITIDELINSLKEYENKPVQENEKTSTYIREKRRKKAITIVIIVVSVVIIYSALLHSIIFNQAPTALAGENIIKEEGENVVLEGSKSFDPEGKQLVYQWKQVNGIELNIPENELNNKSIRFKLPNNLSKDEAFTFELVVSDDKNSKSQKSRVQVTAENINRIPEYRFETIVQKQQDPDHYILDFVISYEIGTGKVILLSDFNNKNILKISPGYNHDHSYIPLSGQYSLIYPVSINGDSNGYIYIYDYGNAKIQKFDLNNLTDIEIWNHTNNQLVNFSALGDITIDSNNNVYVTDMNNNKILKFDSNGTYIPEWRLFYSQFNNTYFDLSSYFGGDDLPDIAIDSNNNVYVTDMNNNKILKFDSNGTYIPEWRSNKGVNLSNIADIAIDSQDNIYVADTLNDRIQKLDSEGNPKNWSSLGNSSLSLDNPEIIKIDQNDNLYSINTTKASIKIFNINGTYSNELLYTIEDLTPNTFSGFSGPAIIKLDTKGFLYAIDFGRCYRFDPPSNSSIQYSISEFTFNCNPRDISDLSIDPSNNSIYISDMTNKVSRFDIKDAKITKFSKNGRDIADPLEGVQSIAASSENFVYVSEQGKNRILKYDENFNFIKEQKQSSINNDFLDVPSSLTIDSNDNVYVYEQGKNRIIKYDSELNFKDQFDLSIYNFSNDYYRYYDIDTYSLNKSSANLLYISNPLQNKILIVDTLSKEFKTIGKSGVARGFFKGLSSIDVDKNGNIFIADSYNDRIQKAIPLFP